MDCSLPESLYVQVYDADKSETSCSYKVNSAVFEVGLSLAYSYSKMWFWSVFLFWNCWSEMCSPVWRRLLHEYTEALLSCHEISFKIPLINPAHWFLQSTTGDSRRHSKPSVAAIHLIIKCWIMHAAVHSECTLILDTSRVGRVPRSFTDRKYAVREMVK